MTANHDNLLSIDGLRTGYLSGAPVIDDLSLSVAGGEIVAIVGPNGGGKSTILKSIMGLVPAWAGSVQFQGRSLNGLRVHQVVLRGISFVPQGEIVFPLMTVKENLQMAWFAVRQTDVDPEERRETVLQLFPQLRHRMNQRANSLSGGEQQMVALGRALMTRPRLLLLDEPSLGLAPKFLDMLLDTLLQLRESGLGIALVEQNAAMALDTGDRGYVLDMGRVRYQGPARDLLHSEEVRRLYVGGHAPDPDEQREESP